MTKRYLVIPDMHLPYEDRKAVKTLIKFIGEYQPDEVVQIGDIMDYPQPSRWSKGTAAEYEGSVFVDSRYAQDRFLEPLREVYSGPFGVIEGNHDSRPRTYLSTYAPALAESGEFELSKLLDFKRFRVDMLPDFYDVLPGWTMTHGHKGGIRLSQIAGNTALNAAKKFGRSIIMGHTHRLAVGAFAEGYQGEVHRTLTGFEVGHLANMKLMDYLKGAAGNWQAGFGIVHVDGKHVHPERIPITNNRFIVDGVKYVVGS